MGEPGQEHQGSDIFEKLDQEVVSMGESGQESQFNDISEKQECEVGSMEVYGQQSQFYDISDKQDNKVESMEESGQEGRVNDISSKQDNDMGSVEEPGRESQVNDISEKQENKVGSIEETEQESQVDYISKKQENEVESMEEPGQESEVNYTSNIQEDEPTEWTISWNEAIRREHEYQKKMENFLLQFPDSFELLPIRSQERNLNAHISGMKRKSLENLSYGDCSEAENKVILLQKRSDQVTNFESLPGKQRVSFLGKPEGVHEQNPSPYLQLHCKKIAQEQKQRVMPHQFLIQGASWQLVKKYWCHICRVQCPSPESLSKHQQGRRHKNQVELLIQEKQKMAGCKIFWCQTCNVPCSGVVSMRQHLQGKRHQASIKMQHVGTSRNFEVKLDAANADYKPMSGELHQPECSESSMKETTSATTVESTVPMVQNQRLRTSNWPNCSTHQTSCVNLPTKWCSSAMGVSRRGRRSLWWSCTSNLRSMKQCKISATVQINSGNKNILFSIGSTCATHMPYGCNHVL